MTTREILLQANAAKAQAAFLTTQKKNEALLYMAEEIVLHTAEILAANAADLSAAEGKISEVMLDRLRLTEGRIEGMAEGIRQVAALPDPVGRVLEKINRPSGIEVTKISVPLGVVAIIYESRPNVTSDAAALCIKSGNVCVLRIGKEAYCSARAIVDAMKMGLERAGLSEYFINLVEDTSRQSSVDIMTATGLVDLLIPRGGAGLINACVQNAKVPCIQTGTGICHVYVDSAADFEWHLISSKTQSAAAPRCATLWRSALCTGTLPRAFCPPCIKGWLRAERSTPCF